MVEIRVIPWESSDTGGPLGRNLRHDERSKAYRIARQPVIRSAWHRRLVPVYDQSSIIDLGSCVPHAGMGVLSTTPFRRHCTSERRIIAIYSALTAVDDVPGQYPPDDTGSDGLSFAKYAKSQAWCGSYLHAFGIDGVLHGIQTTALMCGTDWLDGMDQPDADGRVHPAGSIRGGHEYELNRYAQRGTVRNDHEDRLWFWNSWGQWGRRGRFYMIVAEFAGLLERQGDVTQLVPLSG